MPSHSHSASCSTAALTGNFSVVRRGGSQGSVPYGNGIVSSAGNFNANNGKGDSDDWGTTYQINATHAHTITIDKSGGNGLHENRQPYTVVSFWRRTA